MAVTVLRWVLAVGLLYFWVMPLACNLWGPVSMVANRWRRVPMRHVSMAPFIGGIAGVFILMLIPVEAVQRNRWAMVVALLPEIVCGASLVLGLVMMCLGRGRRSG